MSVGNAQKYFRPSTAKLARNGSASTQNLVNDNSVALHNNFIQVQ